MDLDEYKQILEQPPLKVYQLKQPVELTTYLKSRTASVIGKIVRNLQLEMAFAFLFLLFDCYMFVVFAEVFFLKAFTAFLMIFCVAFIFYVARLWRYISIHYAMDGNVKDQLTKYTKILSRFTRLYFQVTMVMIPLILFLAFLATYLDLNLSSGLDNIFTDRTIIMYFCGALLWSFIMYFVTKWYIRRSYGNHLDELKRQLRELQ